MSFSVQADPLPLRLDSGGTYRVGKTRVRLDTVIFAYNQGSSAEQIAREFPTLDVADVHSVIGYYLRHRSEVDAYLREREREAEELRRQLEAKGRVMTPAKRAELRRRFEERQHRGS
jgi:uncharacterized protein (DUF433 family)